MLPTPIHPDVAAYLNHLLGAAAGTPGSGNKGTPGLGGLMPKPGGQSLAGNFGLRNNFPDYPSPNHNGDHGEHGVPPELAPILIPLGGSGGAGQPVVVDPGERGVAGALGGLLGGMYPTTEGQSNHSGMTGKIHPRQIKLLTTLLQRKGLSN